MPMTSEAKSTLSTTIRSLRGRLLDDLHAGTESTYRLSVPIRDAGLDEAARVRRTRLEAWVAEQLRAQGIGKVKSLRSAEDFRREAEKQAAYTFLNRIVLLRLMEAPGPSGRPLRTPAVVTGGWESRAFKDFRQLAPGLVRGDATEGYAFLLQLVFEDLATELPGLYGPAGVAELVSVPAATLRHVVDALNSPELESCWTDDMTLGWVYQYWNDPEREALDVKLNGGGKVELHEIASKTQMFTERYMVDWLLQNSLNPMWLAICKKNGWTPEVEADGTLNALEVRRSEWRTKREAGEADLTTLMPLYNEAERNWVYYVPQPIPEDTIANAPDSLRDLKLIDPAVGSGHFLVVALDLLMELYRQEARQRGEVGGEKWTDSAIVGRIVSHNLHGIDLDPRAVQIAAAALWLKAHQVAPEVRLERINLVASHLRLASLPDDDPALVELRRAVERETGIPGRLTDRLVHALHGADHLGSLLKIDHAVEKALIRQESALSGIVQMQGDLFGGFTDGRKRKLVGREEARATLLDLIEGFLTKHTSGDDLGLRLRGEQLAAGVRFVRMVREETYDLVLANPPYLNTKKLGERKTIQSAYPSGRADLYCAFLLRSRELVHRGGYAALVTQRDWLCLENYEDFRAHYVAGEAGLITVADLSFGAFPEAKDVSVAMTVSQPKSSCVTTIVQPVPTEFVVRNRSQWCRNVAGLQIQPKVFRVPLSRFKSIKGTPFVYQWSDNRLRMYAESPKIGEVAPVGQGMATSNNPRFLRYPYEVPQTSVMIHPASDLGLDLVTATWIPYVKGAGGAVWFEPLDCVIQWRSNGLEQKLFHEKKYSSYTKRIPNESLFGKPAVSFNTVGRSFTARIVPNASIFDVRGSAVFPPSDLLSRVLLVMNSNYGREDAESFNPGVNFQVGDVRRIHIRSTDNDSYPVVDTLEKAFKRFEAARECSSFFTAPGPSPWRHAQEWGQTAVNRAEGTPLADYVEQLDTEPTTNHLSFALGVALGRFGANGEGILDPITADLKHALPYGVLFLDTTLDADDKSDGLGHSATTPLHAAWVKYDGVGTKRGLREWLAWEFFKDVHKSMYDNRPIHWPLSSSEKTFVAWVNIHRFTEQTLRALLADHLMLTLARLEGKLNDLRSTRDGVDKKAARTAEKEFERVMKAKSELQAFIEDVEQCADRGALPSDIKCPAREKDARYSPVLDDGVMINSAALWPLLDPQWKDPKKWWKELSTANGRNDYDWSHLAMCYWPSRVDMKCQNDPSLGVAHGCLWRYHPERAWSWELRLQDEIAPDFRIKEAPYRPGGRDFGDTGDDSHREAFLRDSPTKALTIIEKEAVRRMGRGTSRKPISEMHIMETGLWSCHAADVWEMELRLSERQGSEVRLLAPDESEARAAFEAKHPEKVEKRREFLANLVPHPELFEDDEESAGDDALNYVDEDEEVES